MKQGNLWGRLCVVLLFLTLTACGGGGGGGGNGGGVNSSPASSVSSANTSAASSINSSAQSSAEGSESSASENNSSSVAESSASSLESSISSEAQSSADVASSSAASSLIGTPATSSSSSEISSSNSSAQSSTSNSEASSSSSDSESSASSSETSSSSSSAESSTSSSETSSSSSTAESSASSSEMNSSTSSTEGSSSSSEASSSSSSAESSTSSSETSSSSSSEDPLPIFTAPDLVDVTTLNLIQDQFINISLDNIGGEDLTECSSDLPESFTVAVSSDASTCEISGDASELIDLTHFTVTAINIDGSDTAQVPLHIQAATPFITTWKTDNDGASEDNQITITTSPSFEYNYNIDWGDGSTDENVTGDITHTYATPGEYQIAITGRFPQNYFFFGESVTDANKLLSVDAWGNRVWLSMEFAFAGATNLVINDTQAPDLSRVTSMFGTFAIAYNFTSDISHWDVSNVTDMTGTFYYAENFNGDLSHWDVSNVSNMSYLFSGAFNFNSDISNWNVTNVSNMNSMFYEASSFNRDISSWDVANVTDFSFMFEYASAFNQNLGSWNISNATSIDAFAEDSGLSIENYDALLLGWSLLPLQQNLTIDVGSIQYTAAAEAARFILTDTFGWNVYDGGLLTVPDLQDQSINAQTNNQVFISIKNTGGKPDSCTADTLPDGLSVKVANSTCEIIGTIATAQTTSFTVSATNIVGNSSAFIELSVAEQTPFVTRWKTDNPGISDDNQITILTSPSFSYNFRVEWGDGSVNENVTGDITHTYASPGEYTVSITGTFPRTFFSATSDSQKLLSVEKWGNQVWRTMEDAFYGCRNLVINDTESPDLSQVTSMRRMFASAGNLSGNISNWDVSNVEDMWEMFLQAGNFNLDISGWDVSNVTTMGSMFNRAAAFNQDISQWNTSKVTDMSQMFRSAGNFNQPIGNWNVANVSNMQEMFRIASKFNQDISQWNTAKVSNMFAMLREASVFNQPIGNWNVANVTNMGDMFYAAELFNADISHWDVAKATKMERMFMRTKTFNQNLGSWNVSNVTTMSQMFTEGVLSTENYDAILTGWSQLASLKNGVALNVGTTRFSASAQAARDTLINNAGWTITDGGLAE